jgi:peptide chain release factor subunit 1
VPTTPTQLRRLLHRVAEWPADEAPVVSAYLDLRPQATGQNPQLRSGQIVMRDRLREIGREYEAHTPAHESLARDAERITRYVEDDALPEAQGVALFACSARDIFEAADTARELENDVTVGRHARLRPLARLADEEAAVVALADTNTLRLFALRSGSLEEVGLVDDEPDDYGKRDVGGGSQARFERHVEEHREEFARLAAEAVDDLVRAEDAEVVLLCGDEVAIPILREQLAQHVGQLVAGVLRLEMRASLEEVEAQALPKLEEVHAARAADAADRLHGAVRGDAMGVAGVDATRRALELGQVMELITDPAAELGDEAFEELIRLAALTDARVRFVEDHGGLRELGGVGGLLRFRLDRAVNEPAG